MKRALIVVDVQNDFCEGGSLAVAGGAAVAAGVTAMLTDPARSATYDAVVATKDHHIDPGAHWSSEPDFVDSWPVHCEVGTEGEEFHPSLDPEAFDAVFMKGEYDAAYSGFEGRTTDGAGLAAWLRSHDITDVDVCGIATDFCVRSTVLDAVAAGFAVRVLVELIRGVSSAGSAIAVNAMLSAGAGLADSTLDG